MAHEIFISYSRGDQNLVHPFVAEINQALGIECWIDLDGIESGTKFQRKLMEAIDSCKVVLFMLSNKSLASEWTEREVMYAEDEGKRIVPVLVDGDKLRGWFKFHFGNVDYIDIRSEEQKQKLIRNLRSWLGTKEENSVEEVVKNKSEEEANREEESRRKIKEKETLLAGEEEKNDSMELWPIKDEKSGLYGFVNKERKVIIPYQWKNVANFSNGVARVKDTNDKWGLVNEKGHEIVPCQWEDCGPFSEDLAWIKIGKWNWFKGQYGYIDRTGKVVIPCKWKKVRDFSDGLAVVEDGSGKYGFINKTGKLVIPCKWKSAYNFSEGLAAVQDSDTWDWGFINKKANLIIPCKWNSVGGFINGIAIVKDHSWNEWKIDKTGAIVGGTGAI